MRLSRLAGEVMAEVGAIFRNEWRDYGAILRVVRKSAMARFKLADCGKSTKSFPGLPSHEPGLQFIEVPQHGLRDFGRVPGLTVVDWSV